MENLKKGDIVTFIPEYADAKIEFEYVLIEDPDGGRVKVSPFNSGLSFPPVQVVMTDWLIMKTKTK